MHIYAKNHVGEITPSYRAEAKKNYFCLECGDPVRVRRPFERMAHFFHIQPRVSCRQHKKSREHIETQLHILRMLPEGEAVLERGFSEIGRIADVCWEEKKIIFEVQCSPINPYDLKARNRDYAKLGYRVVWIFHTNRYGQSTLSPAEIVMAGSAHYYTDIDKDGKGVIFDRWSGFVGCAVVNLAVVKCREGRLPYRFRPSALRGRAEAWRVYFEGDLVDAILSGRGHPLVEMIQFEENRREGPLWRRIPALMRYGVRRYIVRPYMILFQIVLESHCKFGR
jgi:competence protein CoiA